MASMSSAGAALAAGLCLGFLVAAQVGPIWLLCARTALRFGLVPALAVGLGAAVVDFLYACLGVAGAAGLLRVTGLRVGLGLLGAGVLVCLGGRTLWSALRVRAGMETESEVASAWAALRTSVVATASNPLTIASWAAIFAAASTARFTDGTSDTVALLVGIGVGSLAWHVVLSVGMRLAGRRIGERGLRIADGLAGLGMIGYGGLLGLRTLSDG
jgi:threonine/homoserine/homoserine lactone efflux protein